MTLDQTNRLGAPPKQDPLRCSRPLGGGIATGMALPGAVSDRRRPAEAATDPGPRIVERSPGANASGEPIGRFGARWARVSIDGKGRGCHR
jgi:hypothetical protein